MPRVSRTYTQSPDPSTSNRNKLNITIMEVGCCWDFGCNSKLQEKIDKYAQLVNALRDTRGLVKFVAIPIGHARPTLNKNHQSLAQALSITRLMMYILYSCTA